MTVTVKASTFYFKRGIETRTQKCTYQTRMESLPCCPKPFIAAKDNLQKTDISTPHNASVLHNNLNAISIRPAHNTEAVVNQQLGFLTQLWSFIPCSSSTAQQTLRQQVSLFVSTSRSQMKKIQLGFIVLLQSGRSAALFYCSSFIGGLKSLLKRSVRQFMALRKISTYFFF